MKESYINKVMKESYINYVSTFDSYQKHAESTAVYPKENWMEYLSTGMAGEVGELCSKVAKAYRKDKPVVKEELMAELGDVLWFISEFARNMDYSLSYVADQNIIKLKSRKERGVIQGDGDKR